MKYKYKSLLLIALLFTLLTSVCSAAIPNVTADDNYFDPERGQYVLTGNVVVTIGSRTITADSARFSPTTLEVWCDSNVTLTQGDIYFTGGSLYANCFARTAGIYGGANFSRSGLAITSDSATFNWKTKIAAFSGNVTINQNGNTRTTSYQEYNVVTDTFQ